MSPEKFPINPDWSVRELLRRSQTDVTPDHDQGLYYATVAYDRALSPDYREQDPTAAGEAAAKAMFRTYQLDYPDEISKEWLERSVDELYGTDTENRRQLIATHLLAGRGMALKLIRNWETTDNKLEMSADIHFGIANTLFAIIGKTKKSDPYDTMLKVHQSVFESMRINSDTVTARRIALTGIASALNSRKEQANSASESLIKHAKFVAKHVLLNTVALGLAVSRPFNSIEPVAQRRRDLALKILG